ncbi:MAG TPA: YoaK family protein [Herpetosiphonaceae bacterium]
MNASTQNNDQPLLLQRRPWILGFGMLLAAIGGFINTISLYLFQVPVTHVTGAISRLDLDLGIADYGNARLYAALLGGFLAGAVLCGVIIGGSALPPGRRYGLTLLLVGAIVAGSTWLLSHHLAGGLPALALACGMQNAMYSSYHGQFMRTTHMTGTVTDIGVMIGHWIRHRRVQGWKLRLLLGLLGAFFAGGLLGMAAARPLGVGALWIAALLCCVGGAAYFAHKSSWIRLPRRPGEA